MKKQNSVLDFFNRFPWRGVIAIITLVCVFGYMFFDRAYGKTDKETNDVKIALITLATLVLTYYFGASEGKTRTDEREALKQIVNEVPPAQRAELIKPEENKEI